MIGTDDHSWGHERASLRVHTMEKRNHLYMTVCSYVVLNGYFNILRTKWPMLFCRQYLQGHFPYSKSFVFCLKIQSWKAVTDDSIHYNDVIMGAIGSHITSLTIVYSTVYSDTDQRKHQSSASLAFVWGIHRVPVNSPHKWPVTRKMFPFDDVIMRHVDVGLCDGSDDPCHWCMLYPSSMS